MLGLALAAAVIAVSHPDRIWASLQQVELLPLIEALALNVPVVVLRAYRAQVVVAHLDHRVSMRHMMPIQLVGQTSSALTPAASGDFVRAYLWRRSDSVPLRVGAAVVMFERLYSLWLLIAVSVLLITLPRHGVFGWVAVAVGLALGTVAPLLFELFPPAIEKWALAKVTRGRFFGRFADGAQGMMDHFRALMRAPILLAWTSFISIAIFILSGVQIWLGSADAILVTLFAGYGVTVTLAATVAVLLRAVTTVPQALAGLAAYAMVQKGSTEAEFEVQ
ncbi:MAG: hypothetical protein AUI15_02735 [Actinobacteria bacterium 13_2_20CM_2_66_6]|nr:MAG: hypothetical protein AUI15_02735 [Actinobacteria bacterium 13_2_20CM_2_66_6]